MGRDETPRPDVPGELTGSQRSGMGAQSGSGAQV